MNHHELHNKRKMQLTVGLIMLIIVTAWILNLKNSFSSPAPADDNDDNMENLELQKKWSEISSDLGSIFGNIKELQKSLAQSPTSSGADLQGGPPLSPDELSEVIEKLKVDSSTSTPTTTAELNSLP